MCPRTIILEKLCYSWYNIQHPDNLEFPRGEQDHWLSRLETTIGKKLLILMDTTLKILELTALGTVPLFISQMILLQTH